MEYISLGGDCAVAYQLQKFGLRKQSYPFDWILSPRLNKIIQDECKYMWDESYLTWKNHSSSFPKINEHWDSTLHSTIRIVHSHYHITYLHDISTDEEKSLEVKKAREKYEKRINRFHNIMKDSSILKKCFRMGKYEPLQEWFTTLGYKNVYIYQHESVSGSDWKRNEWDWESWFNSNPNYVIEK